MDKQSFTQFKKCKVINILSISDRKEKKSPITLKIDRLKRCTDCKLQLLHIQKSCNVVNAHYLNPILLR